MKPQTIALINRQVTTRDVDEWMEDLLIRIELRIMYPHRVIHQDGTASEQETVVWHCKKSSVDGLSPQR